MKLINALQKVNAGETIKVKQKLEHFNLLGHFDLVCLLETENMAVFRSAEEDSPDFEFDSVKSIVITINQVDYKVTPSLFSYDKDFLVLKYEKVSLTLAKPELKAIERKPSPRNSDKREHTRFEFDQLTAKQKTKVVHLDQKKQFKCLVKNISRGGCLLVMHNDDGIHFNKEDAVVFRYIAGVQVESLTAEVIFSTEFELDPDFTQVAFRFDGLISMPKILEITKAK